MTATERLALDAMRAARDYNGWTEESLLVDTGKQALIAKGVAENSAEAAAQLVFNAHFKTWGPC